MVLRFMKQINISVLTQIARDWYKARKFNEVYDSKAPMIITIAGLDHWLELTKRQHRR
jgi:hypothetical protein